MWFILKRFKKVKELLGLLKESQNFLQINDPKQFEVFKRISEWL